MCHAVNLPIKWWLSGRSWWSSVAGSVICVMKCGCPSPEKRRLVLPSAMARGARGDWLWWSAHEHEYHHSFALSDGCDLAEHSKRRRMPELSPWWDSPVLWESTLAQTFLSLLRVISCLERWVVKGLDVARSVLLRDWCSRWRFALGIEDSPI